MLLAARVVTMLLAAQIFVNSMVRRIRAARSALLTHQCQIPMKAMPSFCARGES
jgi:hypothetical protein